MSAPEPMSDERRAEIDALMDVGGPSMPWVAAEAIIDLAAEVDRLRAITEAARRWAAAHAAFQLADTDSSDDDGWITARATLHEATKALLTLADPVRLPEPEPEPEPECNGICTTGWDLGLAEYGDTIADAHPDCPLHGERPAEKGGE